MTALNYQIQYNVLSLDLRACREVNPRTMEWNANSWQAEKMTNDASLSVSDSMRSSTWRVVVDQCGSLSLSGAHCYLFTLDSSVIAGILMSAALSKHVVQDSSSAFSIWAIEELLQRYHVIMCLIDG